MTSPARASAGAGRDAVAARRLAGWLALAATPTFAGMAVLTALLGGAAGQGVVLGGMVPMYLLMSAFHAGAWLQWMAARRKTVSG